MPKLRVLIVDDAVVVRRMLSDVLGADPDIEVQTAANGKIALAKIAQTPPDCITLDMEMPEMDGITTVRELRKTNRTLPVIMFSTLTEKGAEVTLDALAAGANDYVTKPANVGSVSAAMARIREDLIPKIKALCGRAGQPTPQVDRVQPPSVHANSKAPSESKGSFAGSYAIKSTREVLDIVAIGVSTGGPNALWELLPALPADLPVPIVIVQHMPPIFTKLLADRLKGGCKIDVVEGADGTILRPGQAVIAAGGSHMIVQKRGTMVQIATNMSPPENSCRPAVDVLFRSVASVYPGRTLGVILTGMGNDGQRGCEHLRESGSEVFAQDEATSVVWGMPGAVTRAGLAQKVLPLNQLAGAITERVIRGRPMLRRAV